MSEPDLLGQVIASARELVYEVASRADLAGIKDALAEIEQASRRDRLDAHVVSAVPLTEVERRTVEERLRARHGADLPIRFEVEPAILGGLVVRVGDRLIDGSVATRLRELRQSLTGTS
jgi:ATP synthase F1 delta subunit